MKNHVAFVITRWSYGKKEILLRERRGMSEDLKTRQINESLIELGIMKETDDPIKCFFIDNAIGLAEN